MEKNKLWVKTTILIICSTCIIAMSWYIILFFGLSPRKHEHNEPYPNKIITNEFDSEIDDKKFQNSSSSTLEEIYHLEMNQSEDSSDTLAAQVSYTDYVRKIPIKLEPEIESHLAQFRKEAGLLHQKYPDSFLISTGSVHKTIALTFDDGPDADATMKIIDILNDYDIPGTFFLIGQQIDRYPEMVRIITENGHSIGNHSWSHKRPTDLSIEELMNEVTKAEQRINSNGTATKLYRPPYGIVNPLQMPVLIEAGYRVICWSVDSMDWYFDNPEQIAACVTESAHPGAIVLMHSAGGQNNRQATIEALPVIIETLSEKGYRFISLDQN